VNRERRTESERGTGQILEVQINTDAEPRMRDSERRNDYSEDEHDLRESERGQVKARRFGQSSKVRARSFQRGYGSVCWPGGSVRHCPVGRLLEKVSVRLL
jgi:hypothetical protein